MFHYNTELITTYQDDCILFLSTDELTEEEKDYIRNVVYQNELLDIFNDEWNEKILEKLYERLKDLDTFRYFMKKISTEILGKENELFGLAILYSYQYMNLMHSCVCDYLNTGNITKNNLAKLQEKIDNLSI